MARMQLSSAFVLLMLLLSVSALSVFGAGQGRLHGNGVDPGASDPVDVIGLEASLVAAPMLRSNRGRGVGGRKMLQSGSAVTSGVLSCNKLVGICGTQASNSGFTSGQFIQSGGGFGAGNGIGNAGSGRGGRNARGGRGGAGNAG